MKPKLVPSIGPEHTGHMFQVDEVIISWAQDITELAAREGISIEEAGAKVERRSEGGLPVVPGEAVRNLATRLAQLQVVMGAEWTGRLRVSHEELRGAPTREEVIFQAFLAQVRERGEEG